MGVEDDINAMFAATKKAADDERRAAEAKRNADRSILDTSPAAVRQAEQRLRELGQILAKTLRDRGVPLLPIMTKGWVGLKRSEHWMWMLTYPSIRDDGLLMFTSRAAGNRLFVDTELRPVTVGGRIALPDPVNHPHVSVPDAVGGGCWLSSDDTIVQARRKDTKTRAIGLYPLEKHLVEQVAKLSL